MKAVLCYLICALVAIITEAHAAPETWFEPVQTETGNASSSFGASLACSSLPAGGYYSFIAVGAPDESSGDGRVHILNPDGIEQTLVAPVSRGGNFGYFVAFMPDINSDNIEELLVGEPNFSGPSGYVHVFLSSTLSGTYQASPCATQSGPASFGSFIQQTSATSIVISAPLFDTPSIQSYGVSYIGFSSCSFVVSSSYDSTGALGSRYGQSLAEIDTGGPGVIIGAPGTTTETGALYREERSASGATLELSGVTVGGNLGASVAARFDSPIVAFSAPFASTSVSVKGYTLGAFSGFTELCGRIIPMSDLSSTAGQALVHLGDTFKSFVGLPTAGQVFGTYRTEASTGGSVVLFGAEAPITCSTLYPINNCALDPDQKQGVAIAGGPHCKSESGNSVIVIGSPGYNGNTGRIDVYEEGTQLLAAVPCSEPTSTPTPTPTWTPSPTVTAAPGVSNTPIPVDPTTTGLPPPETSVSGNSVTITAPQAVASDRLRQTLEKRLRRWCRKKGGRGCRYRAKLSYQFIVTGPRNTSSAVETFELGAFSRQSKRRQINSRKNRVTLRKLKPGSYTGSYRFVFNVTDPKARILGKLSAARQFAVR